jgi:hypothetical protein
MERDRIKKFDPRKIRVFGIDEEIPFALNDRRYGQRHL